jgi:hypothetical protein
MTWERAFLLAREDLFVVVVVVVMFVRAETEGEGAERKDVLRFFHKDEEELSFSSSSSEDDVVMLPAKSTRAFLVLLLVRFIDGRLVILALVLVVSEARDCRK